MSRKLLLRRARSFMGAFDAVVSLVALFAACSGSITGPSAPRRIIAINTVSTDSSAAAYPPGPGAALPPGPGAYFPPGPGAALPPGPGAYFPPGPSIRSGSAFPPGPGATFPPGPGATDTTTSK